MVDDLFLVPAFHMDNPPCKIADVNGRVVFVIKSCSVSNKINISFLPAGIYFFHLDFPHKGVVLKFIKK